MVITPFFELLFSHYLMPGLQVLEQMNRKEQILCDKERRTSLIHHLLTTKIPLWLSNFQNPFYPWT